MRTRAGLSIGLATLAACGGGDGGGMAEADGLDSGSVVQEVVAAERAFSALGTQEGLRTAFLTYFTDSVVTFNPAPEVGTASLEAGPPGPKLTWWPEVAEASRAGDMGYTAGPYRVPLPDSAFAWGHYHSVWGRQPDGSWRVLLDMGGPHGEVAIPDSVVLPAPPGGAVMADDGGPGATGLDELLAADRRFMTRYRAGAESAVRTFALERARFYRFGLEPLRGVEASLRDRSENGERLEWTPTDGGVSTSGDLGYTYGTGSLRRADLGEAERGMSYTRVWRHDGEDWRVVLEVVSPYPPEPAGPGGATGS